MSDESLHIAGALLARSAAGRLDPASDDGKTFHEHLARCASCQARYENMLRLVARTPKELGVPMFYPEPDPVCSRATELVNYAELPLTQKLVTWAHVVYGSCPECGFIAERMGDAFNWKLDPVTERLVQTLGKLAPRQQTPHFAVAMAGGEAPHRGRPVAMNTVVRLAECPDKRDYDLSIHADPPEESGGLWHLKVDFWDDQLPAGFFMVLYEDGWSDRPLYTSSRGSMEISVPGGIYRLGFYNQDQIMVALM